MCYDKVVSATLRIFSFQNPVRTPVKLMMDSPQLTHIHVSQNVPRDSEAEVTIKNPVGCHIHASQVIFFPNRPNLNKESSVLL